MGEGIKSKTAIGTRIGVTKKIGGEGVRELMDGDSEEKTDDEQEKENGALREKGDHITKL